MRIDRDAQEESVELNMTPMIDVVFNLLIFFLVGARYSEIERDIIVDPPAARHAQAVASAPRELVVNVTREGKLVIAGVEYTPEDLERLLARSVEENPDQAVVIRGDRRVILQLPVNVLSLCEKYNVRRKYLATIQPSP